MRVAIVGTGYVGLVSGTCLAEFGFHVTCVDKNKVRIDDLNQGIVPIFEPGLDDLIARNVSAQRLSFTTDLKAAVTSSDIVFIAVGTPPKPDDGHADLSYVYQASEDIAKSISKYTVVVVKSTVPVGTNRAVHDILSKHLLPDLFDVVSNPEFLREGSAISDFMRPDRVVIGATSNRAQEIVGALYRPLNVLETPIMYTSLESAELIKYAANAFLSAKITFINQMADLSEACGADVQDVARGIGLDSRIGKQFLSPGPGYGGSCFPKDTVALVKIAQDNNMPISMIEDVVLYNHARKLKMVDKIEQAVGGDLSNKTIAVLGLTFKPNTDDIRESASLTIIPEMQKRGAIIRATDPAGMKEASHLLENVTLCDDAYETMSDADGVVILTEWNEFKGLDLDKTKKLLKKPIMIDLRNIYAQSEMQTAGFYYVSLGRESVGNRLKIVFGDAA